MKLHVKLHVQLRVHDRPQWLAAGVGLFLGLLAGTAAAGLLP